MGAEQQPEEHQQHACALCQKVIALRAREATIAAETLPDLFSRCSECGHLRGGHAPDCSEAPAVALNPCPCAAEATWYLCVLVPIQRFGRPVEAVTVDDLAECDYCDDCFARKVPPDERQGWQRV